MAQIRLVVNTDLKQAKAAVDTLKTSFFNFIKYICNWNSRIDFFHLPYHQIKII